MLPYLFAHFASRHRLDRGGRASLLLALCFYPVVNNKTILLLPIWLPFLFWLFGHGSIRGWPTVLAFLIPLIIGLVAFLVLAADKDYVVFSAINLRFIAIPSLALDHYADFFAHRELTHFCQVSILRHLRGLPPMANSDRRSAPSIATAISNASFLATEGIASVGLAFAPVSAFVCGVILSAGSMASRHLSPRFIAVSSGIAVQAIMNVPLTDRAACRTESGCCSCGMVADFLRGAGSTVKTISSWQSSQPDHQAAHQCVSGAKKARLTFTGHDATPGLFVSEVGRPPA